MGECSGRERNRKKLKTEQDGTLGKRQQERDKRAGKRQRELLLVVDTLLLIGGLETTPSVLKESQMHSLKRCHHS